jgi:hypothetical protein
MMSLPQLRWSIVSCARIACLLTAVAAPAARAGSPANLGVPQNGFPSWAERSLQVFVNRDRADPQTALAGCTAATCPDAHCYGPVAPLGYDYDLARSARFQLLNLQKSHSPLAHHSPCVLDPMIGAQFPGSCDGTPTCACQGPVECDCSQMTATDCTCDPTSESCVTQPSVRGRYFSSHWMGENLSAGYADPMAAEAGLLLERATCVATTCPPAFTFCPDGTTNGHRANILDDVYDSMGGGDATDPTSCYQSAWDAQDFGNIGAAPQKLVAGTHFPYDAGSVTFYANCYDSAAPSSAVVRIDDTDYPMSADRGDAGNETLRYETVLDAGCHRYVFSFTDATGDTFLLPGSGSYLSGTGCPSDYQTVTDSDAGSDGGGGGSSGSGCSQGGACSALGAMSLALLALPSRRRRARERRGS